MKPISDIARKGRRALRNGTGINLTAEQWRAFADLGALEIAMIAELDELCPNRIRQPRGDPPRPRRPG